MNERICRCGHPASEHYPDEIQNAARPNSAAPVDTCNVGDCGCTCWEAPDLDWAKLGAPMTDPKLALHNRSQERRQGW